MKEDALIRLMKSIRFGKEEFVIPKPTGGEDEQTFISGCISKIKDEYPAEGQAYAICKKSWDEN